jgi:two-component system, chemotaxis family, chemotaxis protein CheY
MSLMNKDTRPYDLSNFTVLLVEDSVYMQSLMISMLKVFGVGDILVCDNGQEAIDLLTITQARRKSRHVNDVDIVLTDWLMPKVSGKELIRWIRNHPSDDVRFLPIIVVSAYTTEKLVALARDCGANESLVKPISGTSLAGRICSVIDNPRPYISIPGYFGPDRRRQDVPYKGGNRRVTAVEEIQVIHGRS